MVLAILGNAAGRDVTACLVLYLTAVMSKRKYCMRGITYRSTVIPLWKENLGKSVFYISALGVIDAMLRRTGQFLAQLGLYFGPRSAIAAACMRIALLHAPFAVWALTGPLSLKGSTRDDRGFSHAATKSGLWRFLSKYVFGHTKIVLSEEWRNLTEEQRAVWYDRHYVIGLHPHGLLPIGAIINGLTWAGGGLTGVTASGAELPEPPNNKGGLLHQRWFRNMKLRACVASGACGLFPGAYEMFTKLGAFECTKPFMREMIREGKDLAIFPGGAQESEYAYPGRYVCLISKHKGFVRLALEERLDILPMWTFGDEALVPQMANPPAFLVAMQHWVKQAVGLLMPFTLASLPRLPPLTMVTGVPVSLEDLWPKTRGDPVSDEAVEIGHKRYIEGQRKTFDLNKAHAILTSSSTSVGYEHGAEIRSNFESAGLLRARL